MARGSGGRYQREIDYSRFELEPSDDLSGRTAPMLARLRTVRFVRVVVAAVVFVVACWLAFALEPDGVVEMLLLGLVMASGLGTIVGIYLLVRAHRALVLARYETDPSRMPPT